MLLKPEISVGDILTIVSIAISVIALLISWQKSQELKRKEFADKIRRGSSTVVVKIQRWRELSIRFFEDIQPLITEADIELVRNQKVPDVRDTFWLKISDVRTMTSQRIIDEQVETAYIDLFGFDPRIQTLFTEVISRLRAIDKSIYTQTRYSTQADILSFLPQSGQFTRTELGNKLRNTCDLLCNECQRLMDESIEPFIKEMVRLIEQNDSQIVKRRFKISSATDLYPISLNQLQEMLDEQVNLKLIQIATASITSTLPNGGDLVRDIVARSLPPNVGYSIASILPKS